MTTHRSRETSPLKRKGSIASLYSDSVAGSLKKNQLSKQQIELLIQKFNDVNETIEVGADQSNFNLIEYRGRDRKYYHQMGKTELRKLENQAEIKRAQLEIDHRMRKKFKKMDRKIKLPEESYTTIYNKFIKNKQAPVKHEENSDDESQANHDTQPKPVAFFSQLKRHPKLLEYTIQKIDNKSKTIDTREEKLKSLLEKHRKSQQNLSEDYKQLMEEVMKKNNQKQDINPQIVIENQYGKLFSRKSSQNLNKQIKKLPRCSKMIEKQNVILSQMDQKSLSKDNKKKLKSRLNEIIFRISKTERPLAKTKNAHSKTIDIGSHYNSGFILPQIGLQSRNKSFNRSTHQQL